MKQPDALTLIEVTKKGTVALIIVITRQIAILINLLPVGNLSP